MDPQKRPDISDGSASAGAVPIARRIGNGISAGSSFATAPYVVAADEEGLIPAA